MGGVASRRALLKVVERRALDAALRRGDIVRDALGRYALPLADEARRAANRLSGMVSHRSTALLHGWVVETVPDRPDVTVRRKRHLSPAQRAEVTPHWVDLGPDEVHQGVTTVSARSSTACGRCRSTRRWRSPTQQAPEHLQIPTGRAGGRAARALGGPGEAGGARGDAPGGQSVRVRRPSDRSRPSRPRPEAPGGHQGPHRPRPRRPRGS